MTPQTHENGPQSDGEGADVSQEGRGEIGAHVAVWTGYGWSLECSEPPDAQCRARFTCDCEAFGQYEVHDGKPVHLAYDSDRDVDRWHVGEFLPTWCNLAEWWDGGEGWEQEGFEGKVRVPVSFEWTFDGPEFTASPERDDLAARLAEAEARADEAEARFNRYREQFREITFEGMSLADWHTKHCAAQQVAVETQERLAEAEAKVARVEALASEWERRTDRTPDRVLEFWLRRVRAALDGPR